MKPPAATSPAPAKADFFKNVLRVIFFFMFPPFCLGISSLFALEQGVEKQASGR
jgi:hypothetical protein